MEATAIMVCVRVCIHNLIGTKCSHKRNIVVFVMTRDINNHKWCRYKGRPRIFINSRGHSVVRKPMMQQFFYSLK